MSMCDSWKVEARKSKVETRKSKLESRISKVETRKSEVETRKSKLEEISVKKVAFFRQLRNGAEYVARAFCDIVLLH